MGDLKISEWSCALRKVRYSFSGLARVPALMELIGSGHVMQVAVLLSQLSPVT